MIHGSQCDVLLLSIKQTDYVQPSLRLRDKKNTHKLWFTGIRRLFGTQLHSQIGCMEQGHCRDVSSDFRLAFSVKPFVRELNDSEEMER
jgi:hypothetical protein